jgi:putative DNA primase/helicase
MDYTSPEGLMSGIGGKLKIESSGPDKPGPRGEMHGRLLVLGISDLDTAPSRDYFLKGLISPGEMSIWVGAPKCGKSFLLLYVAYMLSLGRSVFGRRVKPTKVLYVAAEGEGGIAKRVRALRNKYGPSANFHFIAQPIDLLRNGGHKLEVIDAATAVGAQLIVVDTLNRALAGGDENSPQDMGTFVTNASDIKHHTGAHVAIIHHGTKASNGSTPRGHGSLEGADDALIEVAKLEDGSRVATVIHTKDDADGMRWGFKLDVVELGTDDDGDPITTLIVVESAGPPDRNERKPKPSADQQVALQCLERVMRDEATTATVGDNHEARPVVTEIAWRREYYSVAKPGETQDSKSQAFRRAVDGLQAKGIIASQDGFVWRPSVW